MFNLNTHGYLIQITTSEVYMFICDKENHNSVCSSLSYQCLLFHCHDKATSNCRLYVRIHRYHTSTSLKIYIVDSCILMKHVFVGRGSHRLRRNEAIYKKNDLGEDMNRKEIWLKRYLLASSH